MSSEIDRRLSKVEAALSPLTVSTFRVIDCQGLELEQIFAKVQAALPEGSEELFAKILQQTNERQAEKGYSGFGVWLHGLEAGWLYLPKKIPLVVLEAFAEGHPNMPFDRCEDCGLGLPSTMTHPRWGSCPACESTRIYRSVLSRPWGMFTESGQAP